MRRRFGGLAAIAAIALFAGIPAATAGTTGQVVAATVSPGSKLSPEGRWYLLPAKAGETVTQSVHLLNPNKNPVTVNLEPVDAQTGSSTGVAYAPPGSAKAVTSRWIVISTPQLTLQPGEERDVPFTVHVPPGITAGQYLAAVSASIPVASSPKPKNLGANQAGFNMDVQYQRDIAVEVDVPGPRAPQLVVTGAEAMASPTGVLLGVHIANQGNAFAHGTGVITVADTNTDYTFKIDTFVSQTAIVFPMPWTKTVVPGTHHVQVDLKYEGGRRTSWNGDIAIAGTTQTNLENAMRNVTVHNSPGFPWILLAIVLVAVLIGGAVLMRHRSRDRRYVKYRAA